MKDVSVFVCLYFCAHVCVYVCVCSRTNRCNSVNLSANHHQHIMRPLSLLEETTNYLLSYKTVVMIHFGLGNNELDNHHRGNNNSHTVEGRRLLWLKESGASLGWQEMRTSSL